MSSKFKVLSIALVSALVLSVFVPTALADVTGSFGTHISIHPQTTAREISLINFDIQNSLDVNVVISGLATGFHTHFGIAGIEDAIISSSATLGALDLQTLLVFGRFPCPPVHDGDCIPNNINDSLPYYADLHFIKKYVKATLTLGGVTFMNEAQFEDTNAFGAAVGINPNPALGPQSTAYAFGDVVSIMGQTPSGIGVSAATGICMTLDPNRIKKHPNLTPYTVNPHCGADTSDTTQSGSITVPRVPDEKPDLLFDFEVLHIEGVPLAPAVTASSWLVCETIFGCELTTMVNFSGGPIPFSTEFTFTDLLTLDFGGATIALQSGAGALLIGITETGEIGAVGVEVSAVINADTNAAILEIDGSITPRSGLDFALVHLVVPRNGLLLGVWALFAGGPPAQFQFVQFHVNLPGPPLTLEAKTTFTASGLIEGAIWLTVDF